MPLGEQSIGSIFPTSIVGSVIPLFDLFLQRSARRHEYKPLRAPPQCVQPVFAARVSGTLISACRVYGPSKSAPNKKPNALRFRAPLRIMATEMATMAAIASFLSPDR
jgi:hypothetical protein